MYSHDDTCYLWYMYREEELSREGMAFKMPCAATYAFVCNLPLQAFTHGMHWMALTLLSGAHAARTHHTLIHFQ